MGRTEAARGLLTAALDYIAKEAPGKYPEECVLLLHNRARLQTAHGQSDGAIADLTELLRQQPGDSEAHLDRGVLFQRAGKYDEALDDYNAAIQWSPPYPEPFFNRAQTLTALGRVNEALTDYDYVLTLDPGHVEALNDRACLHYHQGMFGAARNDIDRGTSAPVPSSSDSNQEILTCGPAKIPYPLMIGSSSVFRPGPLINKGLRRLFDAGGFGIVHAPTRACEGMLGRSFAQEFI